MNFVTILATAVVAVSASTTIAKPSSLPPCYAHPDDADEEMISCLVAACESYHSEWIDCQELDPKETDKCTFNALVFYIGRWFDCTLEMSPMVVLDLVEEFIRGSNAEHLGPPIIPACGYSGASPVLLSVDFPL